MEKLLRHCKLPLQALVLTCLAAAPSFADAFSISLNGRLLVPVANHTGFNDLAKRLLVKGSWRCGDPSQGWTPRFNRVSDSGALDFAWNRDDEGNAISQLLLNTPPQTLDVSWLARYKCRADIEFVLVVEKNRYVKTVLHFEAESADLLSKNIANTLANPMESMRFAVFYLKPTVLPSTQRNDRFFRKPFAFKQWFNGQSFGPFHPFGENGPSHGLQSQSSLRAHKVGNQWFLPELFWVGADCGTDPSLQTRYKHLWFLQFGSNHSVELPGNMVEENFYEYLADWLSRPER